MGGNPRAGSSPAVGTAVAPVILPDTADKWHRSAHSKMISKLPPWIWPGAWTLALMAGIINVVGLLSFQRQPITHLTGTTTMLADALSRFDFQALLHFAVIIGSFMVGTMVSGYLVQDATLKLGRRYVAALWLEALLLALAIPLLQHTRNEGLYCAACACGLQNAMISTFSGTVVRTTHVSGMFTDLGIALGHLLRGIEVDRRRVQLCAVVISGFLIGGVVGALSFRAWSYLALGIPSILAVGLGVQVERQRRKLNASS